MVVVICGIALLYTVVERRIKELPAAAERATFYAVLEQIRTGVNLAMLSRVASRDFDTLQALEGTNPMVFLLETPRNYRGEVNGLEQPGLMRRSWYFDSSRGELVYLTGIASENNVRVLVSGSAISMGVIRLRLTNVYSDSDGVGGGGGGGAMGARGLSTWEGLVLRPVYDFVWEVEVLDLMGL